MNLSALQQALMAFKEMAGGYLTGKTKVTQGQIQGALDQVLNAFNGADKKISKVKPIGEDQLGNVIMSDGSKMPSQKNRLRFERNNPTKEDVRNIEALRKSLLAQTSYTPKMREIIKNLQIIPYGFTNASSQDNQSGGHTWGGEAVFINRNTLSDKKSGYPVGVLRHEMIHNVDEKVGADPGMFNSDNFSSKLQESSPLTYKYINSRLNKFPDLYKLDKRTQDVEGAAYFGQGGESRAMHRGVGDFYKNIYIPASKDINASYLYPSEKMFDQFASSAYDF